MKLDSEKIDRAALALLHLGLHDGNRTWRGFDWDVMNRLHEKGYISDPVGKAKSIVFTDDGLRESERLLEELFAATQETRASLAWCSIGVIRAAKRRQRANRPCD